MALTWVKLGNLRGPGGPMGPLGDGFKRALSSATDNPATHTERGEYTVISGTQADNLGFPMSAAGFFESKPTAAGDQDMQMFLRKSAHPQLMARSKFSDGWSTWNDVGFASLVPLSSTDNFDDLTPGKAYFPPSGTVSENLGLPSSGTVFQRGILEVFAMSSDLRDNSVRMLRWTTLSATPGIFTRSKISGEWRDWTRLDAQGAGPSPQPGTAGLPGQVSIWGSSTPAGVHPELSEALLPYGVDVHQKSSGGEWSSQTIVRIGSTPTNLGPAGGTIPASGPVRVASSFLDGHPVNLLQPCTGWLGGVHGNLVGFGTTAGYYEFSRTTPGSEISMVSGAWVPEVKTPAHLNILAAGKNDLNVGRTTTHLNRVIQRRDQAIAYWWARNSDFLILGHFVNRDTAASDDGRTQIEADNANAKSKYPNNFIDMQALLSGTELWQWTGISPNAEDIAQQALGNMPPSIQGNGNHLNDAGDRYLSHKIIQWMIGKQMIGEGRAPFTTHQHVVGSSGARYRIQVNGSGALSAQPTI